MCAYVFSGKLALSLSLSLSLSHTHTHTHSKSYFKREMSYQDLFKRKLKPIDTSIKSIKHFYHCYAFREQLATEKKEVFEWCREERGVA